MSTPHFAFPFHFGSDGSAVVVAQDTVAEVEQNVLVLVLTERGERIEVPDFGIDDLTFQVELDLDAIAEAAQEWDDRAELLLAEDAIQGMIRDLSMRLEED